MAPVCVREEAATAPRDVGARDPRGGEAVGGGTELPVAGTEGAARPVAGLAPLGWMVGRGEVPEATEGAFPAGFRAGFGAAGHSLDTSTRYRRRHG